MVRFIKDSHSIPLPSLSRIKDHLMFYLNDPFKDINDQREIL